MQLVMDDGQYPKLVLDPSEILDPSGVAIAIIGFKGNPTDTSKYPTQAVLTITREGDARVKVWNNDPEPVLVDFISAGFPSSGGS